MDSIKTIMNTQLNEGDVIIYTLVESGMTLRELGERLNMSYENIRVRSERAKKAMNRLAEAGLFSTPVKPQ